MKVGAKRRDAWLRLDDGALLKGCREERYRTGGPGGQRRNKVETAIRLHHEASGISAHAHESRHLQQNRTRALRRLRERIAFEVRAAFDLEKPVLAPELLAQRGPKRTLSVNSRNPAYTVIVASTLDAFAAAAGSYAKAGQALGLTTSQVLRFLRSNPELWRAAGRVRDEATAG